MMAKTAEVSPYTERVDEMGISLEATRPKGAATMCGKGLLLFVIRSTWRKIEIFRLWFETLASYGAITNCYIRAPQSSCHTDSAEEKW